MQFQDIWNIRFNKNLERHNPYPLIKSRAIGVVYKGEKYHMYPSNPSLIFPENFMDDSIDIPFIIYLIGTFRRLK